MARSEFLINEHGRGVPLDDERLPSALLRSLGLDGIVELAVRENGWVYVLNESDWGRMAIRFDCRSVRSQARLAAGAVMLRRPLSEVRLSYHLCGDNEEVFTDGITASRRLIHLWQAAEVLQPERVNCRALNPDWLYVQDDAASEKLRQVLECWRSKNGVLDDTVVPYLRRIGVLQRTLLIEPVPGGDDGVFTYIGDGFTLYGPEWPQQGIGQPVGAQPDPDYGAWAAKAFKVMMASGLPQFEQVSAQIRSPRDPARRSDYKCLRTLWRTAAGDPVMMTNSFLTPLGDFSFSA